MPPQKVSIPSPAVSAQIKALPKFDADISMFAGWGAQRIADWANQQQGEISLNISNASTQEVSDFRAANEILAASGKKLNLIDEKEKISGITREITSDVIEHAREGFKQFIRKLVQKPQYLIDEFQTYFANREAGFNDLHTWDNLGIAKSQNETRQKVMKLINEVRKEHEGVFKQQVLPHLSDHPNLKSDKDKINTIIASMLSNTVRGLFYNEANVDKVLGVRRIAVDTIKEYLQTGGEGVPKTTPEATPKPKKPGLFTRMWNFCADKWQGVKNVVSNGWKRVKGWFGR